MPLSRVRRHLPLAAVLSILVALTTFSTRTSADSQYCAPFAAVGTDYSALGYDEYHSCCGISAAGSVALQKSNGDIMAAAAVANPYDACRTGTAKRCCPLESNAPTYTDTTGRSITYSFQTVTSDSEYRCVPVFSAGGCCAASDCFDGTDAEWDCDNGLCVADPCPYRPLGVNRAMLLFILPLIIMLLEVMWYACGWRLVSLDFTCGGFGLDMETVQVAMFMVRANVFKFFVLVYYGLLIASHIWNAGDPLTHCAWRENGRVFEWLFACVYVATFGIAWVAHSRPLDPMDSYHTVWMDAILYSNWAHLFPFIFYCVAGGGRSGLDYFILVQQAIGFRWLVPAVLMYPCMSSCPRTASNPVYSGVYRFLDLVFWKSNVSVYERDMYSRRLGYNRRTGQPTNKQQVLQLLHSVPALRATQRALEAQSEFVGHIDCLCSRTLIVAPIHPMYDLDSAELVSPYAAAARRLALMSPQPTGSARVRSSSHLSHPDGDHAQHRHVFDFNRPDRVDEEGEEGVELQQMAQSGQQVTATVDENNRIVALNITMPNSGGLFLPPGSVKGVTPTYIHSAAGSPEATPRDGRPSTASILRAYPLPSESARIHSQGSPPASSTARRSPAADAGRASLNPWSPALSPRKNKPEEDEKEEEVPLHTTPGKSKRAKRRAAEAAAEQAANDDVAPSTPPRSGTKSKLLFGGGPSSSPTGSPSSPPAFLPPLVPRGGKVVDGAYIPPSPTAGTAASSTSPKRPPPTHIDIDEDQARREMDAADRGRATEQAPAMSASARRRAIDEPLESFRMPELDELPETPRD